MTAHTSRTSSDEHPVITELQPLSDTPLRVVSSTPQTLTATGQVAGQLAVHLAQMATLAAAALVDADERSSLHRIDRLSTVVACTSFGGLLIQQVRDIDRFIASVR